MCRMSTSFAKHGQQTFVSVLLMQVWATLTTAIEACTTLQRLNANGWVSSAPPSSFVSMLDSLPCLQRLSLANDLGRDDVFMEGSYHAPELRRQLLDSIMALPNLRDLNISLFGPFEGTQDGWHAAMSAASLTQLQTLQLEEDFREDEVDALDAVIASKLCALFLQAAIPDLHSLQTLQLLDLRFGDAAMEAVAPALSQLTQLQHLYISNHSFQLTGARALAHVLPKLTALRALCLPMDEYGDRDNSIDVAAPLVPAIAQLTALQALDLSSMGMRAGTLRELMRACTALTELRVLKVYDNEFTSGEAADAMSAHIGAYPSLHTVWICLHARDEGVDPIESVATMWRTTTEWRVASGWPPGVVQREMPGLWQHDVPRGSRFGLEPRFEI